MTDGGWRIFGVSYPTIKSRLEHIAGCLDFVDIDPAPTGADVQNAAVGAGRVDQGRTVRDLTAVSCPVPALRSLSVPALQSLGKVQVKRIWGVVKGLKGLKFVIMSQSCVRVRAGASVPLQVWS